MLVPKRETIRSKQLSLPRDKHMGFDRFLVCCLDTSKAQEEAEICVCVRERAGAEVEETHRL